MADCYLSAVLDKPSAPEGPLKVSDVHAKGCKLNWKPPADDGGVPIQKYVVEKMDEATGTCCGSILPPLGLESRSSNPISIVHMSHVLQLCIGI